jgi:hypothetical protein
MTRPSRWTWAWLGWLAAFLAVEIPAAIREKRLGSGAMTLSRHVWFWFRGWRRWILAAFLIALFAHLVFGASALWLLTAIPFVAVIVYSLIEEGEVRERRRVRRLAVGESVDFASRRPGDRVRR